jgi:hypothetical protein
LKGRLIKKDPQDILQAFYFNFSHLPFETTLNENAPRMFFGAKKSSDPSHLLISGPETLEHF